MKLNLTPKYTEKYSQKTSLFLKNKSYLLSLKAMKKNKFQELSLNKNLNFIKRSKHQFISKIYQICELLKYSDKTFYQSYQIFIKIANKKDFSKNEIENISYICLMLSSKFNETPNKILTPKILNQMCPSISLKTICNMERNFIFNLDFKLLTQCETFFLDVYLEFNETFKTINQSYDKELLISTKKKFKSQSKYLLNLYVFSRFYGDFNPDIVALSIIIILRTFNGYHDIMFSNFKSITDLETNDLGICLQVLNKLFEDDSKNEINFDGLNEIETEQSMSDLNP